MRRTITQSGFLFGQRRLPHVDPENVREPEILADALVHHLLMDAAAAPVGRVRSHRQVVVGGHAPHAQRLEALGLVGVDEKIEAHVTWLPSNPLVPGRMTALGPNDDSAAIPAIDRARES